jgi:hypothetical protein
MKMTENIEAIDRKRRTILRVYLIGAALFFASWLARFILRETGVLPSGLSLALAVLLMAGTGVLVYSFVGMLGIRKKMLSDPALKEILNDELVRLNTMKAFRYGFFAMMGGLAFFAVFNFISPVKDFFAAILTLFFVGAWGYMFAFCKLERG